MGSWPSKAPVTMESPRRTSTNQTGALRLGSLAGLRAGQHRIDVPHGAKRLHVKCNEPNRCVRVCVCMDIHTYTHTHTHTHIHIYTDGHPHD